MHCPSCGSEEQKTYQIERECPTCGCEYRRNMNESQVFVPGTYERFVESVIQEVNDKINDPSIRSALQNVSKGFLNDGYEHLPELITHLTEEAELLHNQFLAGLREKEDFGAIVEGIGRLIEWVRLHEDDYEDFDYMSNDEVENVDDVSTDVEMGNDIDIVDPAAFSSAEDAEHDALQRVKDAATDIQNAVQDLESAEDAEHDAVSGEPEPDFTHEPGAMLDKIANDVMMNENYCFRTGDKVYVDWDRKTQWTIRKIDTDNKTIIAESADGQMVEIDPEDDERDIQHAYEEDIDVVAERSSSSHDLIKEKWAQLEDQFNEKIDLGPVGSMSETERSEEERQIIDKAVQDIHTDKLQVQDVLPNVPEHLRDDVLDELRRRGGDIYPERGPDGRGAGWEEVREDEGVLDPNSEQDYELFQNLQDTLPVGSYPDESSNEDELISQIKTGVVPGLYQRPGSTLEPVDVVFSVDQSGKIQDMSSRIEQGDVRSEHPEDDPDEFVSFQKDMEENVDDFDTNVHSDEDSMSDVDLEDYSDSEVESDEKMMQTRLNNALSHVVSNQEMDHMISLKDDPDALADFIGSTYTAANKRFLSSEAKRALFNYILGRPLNTLGESVLNDHFNDVFGNPKPVPFTQDPTNTHSKDVLNDKRWKPDCPVEDCVGEEDEEEQPVVGNGANVGLAEDFIPLHEGDAVYLKEDFDTQWEVYAVAKNPSRVYVQSGKRKNVFNPEHTTWQHVDGVQLAHEREHEGIDHTRTLWESVAAQYDEEKGLKPLTESKLLEGNDYEDMEERDLPVVEKKDMYKHVKEADLHKMQRGLAIQELQKHYGNDIQEMEMVLDDAVLSEGDDSIDDVYGVEEMGELDTQFALEAAYKKMEEELDNYDDTDDEAVDTPTYENVVFFQGDSAQEALQILDQQGPEAAVDFLSQWHYPGEHDVVEDEPWGTQDETFEKDGYTLSYNPRLDYIGLVYDLSHDRMDEVDDNKRHETNLGAELNPKNDRGSDLHLNLGEGWKRNNSINLF